MQLWRRADPIKFNRDAGLHNKHWPAGPPAICSRRASDMQLLLARRAIPNVLYVVPYIGF